MSTPAQIPFVAPDGTPGYVDSSAAQEAASKGYKPGLLMRSKAGDKGIVAFGDLKEAMGNGYTTEGQYQQNQQRIASPPQPQGFMQSLVAPIPQAAQGIYHAFTDAPQSPTEANVKGTSPDSGLAARTLGQVGLGAYRTLIAPSIAAENTAESSVKSGHPLQALSEAAEGIPLVGAGVSVGRQAISQYLSGDKSGAAGSVIGNLLAGGLGAATTGEFGSRLGPIPTVPGENYTAAQLRAHAGILGRMNGLGDNFIPQDSAALTGSVTRQAAADNPAIMAAAVSKGSTPQNIAALQAILQKANTSLEVPHAATIAQHANVPADVTGVQAAVGRSFPKTLSGVSPEDASAIQELQGRLGTINTLGGLNDLRQWLNDEAAAGYKQDGIAAARGTATKAGIRAAADAARNAYYDQLQQASGTDFRPIKAQQSALLDQQEGAAKLGQTLSAQQAIADEGKSGRQVLADALTGGRALKAGPIAGTTQLIAEKLLKTTPLTQPNALIRRFLSDLPEPTQPAASIPAPVASNAPQLPASGSPTSVTGTTVPPTPPVAPTPLLGSPQTNRLLPPPPESNFNGYKFKGVDTVGDGSVYRVEITGPDGKNHGDIQAERNPDGSYMIAHSGVLPESQGKGVGTAAYGKLITDLNNNGHTVTSDWDRSPQAESVWSRLAKQGLAELKPAPQTMIRAADGKSVLTPPGAMIYVADPSLNIAKIPKPYPTLNEATARTRVSPTQFQSPAAVSSGAAPVGATNPLQRFLQAGDLDPTIINPSADDLKRAIAGMRKKRGK